MMPQLVIDIFLDQVSAKELLTRLRKQGDRRGKKIGDGGLGKAFDTPEAMAAFAVENEECRVKEVEKLYDLSRLFREKQTNKPNFHVNENKEAICLALILTSNLNNASLQFVRKVVNRLGVLYSNHFKGQVLSTVTMHEHLIQRFALFPRKNFLAKKWLAAIKDEEIKLPDLKQWSHENRNLFLQWAYSGFSSITEYKASLPTHTLSRSLGRSMSYPSLIEDLTQKQIDAQNPEKLELQAEAKYQTEKLRESVKQTQGQASVEQSESKQPNSGKRLGSLSSSKPAFSIVIEKNNKVFPKPVPLPESAVLPVQQSSFQKISAALNKMSSRDILRIYDPIPTIKTKQKDLLLSQLKEWNLEDIRSLLCLLVLIQLQKADHQSFHFIRMEMSVFHMLSGFTGSTATWQDLCENTQWALLTKLKKENNAPRRPAAEKIKLDNAEYSLYSQLFHAKFTRCYQVADNRLSKHFENTFKESFSWNELKPHK